MKKLDTRKMVTLGLLLVVFLAFTFTTDAFVSPRNISILLKDAGYLGLIALGSSIIIVNGGVDLSTGGMICFVGVVAARAACIPGMPGFAVMLIAAAAGALCGLFNVIVVLKLRLTEFVATLATGMVYSGLALLTIFKDNGRILPVTLTNQSYLVYGRSINGVYYIAIAWIVFTVLMQFVLKKTRFGLYTVAMGSNPKASMMSGIKNAKYKICTFLIGGAFAGLAAAFTVAYQTGTNLQLGGSIAFKAIAACVVGGLVLGGGKGDPISAFMGTLILTMLTNGLYKFGLSTDALNVAYGVLMVAALAFDSLMSMAYAKRLNTRERL